MALPPEYVIPAEFAVRLRTRLEEWLKRHPETPLGRAGYYLIGEHSVEGWNPNPAPGLLEPGLYALTFADQGWLRVVAVTVGGDHRVGAARWARCAEAAPETAPDIALDLEPDAPIPFELVEEPLAGTGEAIQEPVSRRQGLIPVPEGAMGEIRARLTPAQAPRLSSVRGSVDLELTGAERALEEAQREMTRCMDRHARLTAEVAALRDLRRRLDRTLAA